MLYLEILDSKDETKDDDASKTENEGQESEEEKDATSSYLKKVEETVDAKTMKLIDVRIMIHSTKNNAIIIETVIKVYLLKLYLKFRLHSLS